jgi:hypothetical protein
VTARGGLYTRATDGTSNRWQHTRRVDGVWSPYASPALATDGTGRIWLAAVGHDRSLVVQSSAPDATHWRRAHTLGPAVWSLTDSPALTTAATGGMRVGALTTDGRTLWRRATGHELAVGGQNSRGGSFTVALLAMLS